MGGRQCGRRQSSIGGVLELEQLANSWWIWPAVYAWVAFVSAVVVWKRYWKPIMSHRTHQPNVFQSFYQNRPGNFDRNLDILISLVFIAGIPVLMLALGPIVFGWIRSFYGF